MKKIIFFIYCIMLTSVHLFAQELDGVACKMGTETENIHKRFSRKDNAFLNYGQLRICNKKNPLNYFLSTNVVSIPLMRDNFSRILRPSDILKSISILQLTSKD